jgi:hypothetical protein
MGHAMSRRTVPASRLLGLVLALALAAGCGSGEANGPASAAPIGPVSSVTSIPSRNVQLSLDQVRALARANGALVRGVAAFVPADRRCVDALTTRSLTGYAACARAPSRVQEAAAARAALASGRALRWLRGQAADPSACSRRLAGYRLAADRLAAASHALALAARRGDDRGAFALDRRVYPLIRAWGPTARPLVRGCGLVTG